MSFILKSVVLVILFIGTKGSIYAQCDNFPYQLDIDGFTCGSLEGSICFISTYDDITACSDYVVEIEYPTGAFIYTDLNSDDSFIYLYSEAEDKTIIRIEPYAVSTGNIDFSSCIKGLIQIPGTIFKIRIVNQNDSNDVLSENTFTVDDPIPIGSPETTTLLSDAIAQQLLLPPTEALTTAQRISIEGTLIVDVDYTFGFSLGGQTNKIYMEEGAGIEIRDSKILQATRTKFSGCGANWDRINVLSGGTFMLTNNSKISDAAVGIELQDESSVVMQKTTFTNNDIGIGSFGEDLKSISLEFYLDDSGVSGFQYCREGMHFENVSLLILQGLLTIPNSPPLPASPFVDAIIFTNIEENGIYLDHTSLSGIGLRFSDCSTGIRVATANNLLSIDNSKFENSTRAIFDRSSLELTVTNCLFSSCQTDILRGSTVWGEHSLIENNDFSESGRNILAITMPSRAEIQFNSMQALSNNVTVMGYGEGIHQWAIQHNDGDLVSGYAYAPENPNNGNATNVYFVNTNNARIFNNSGLYSYGQNVRIIGGKDNIFGYNDLCVSDANSTYVNGSTGAKIYCNGIAAPFGLKILNDCTGSDIRGNSFSGASLTSNRNIIYGSENNTYAVSSKQFYKGNTFDVSSPNSPKATHYGLPEIAANSKYIVGSHAIQQGDEYYPFFESSFNSWISHNSFDDYVCSPGIIIDDPIVKLQKEKETYLGLLDAGAENIYGNEVGFEVNMGLYKKLKSLEAYEPLNLEDALKKEELAAKSISDFSLLQDMLTYLTTPTEEEVAQITALNEDIEDLVTQINAIKWYTVEGNSLLLTIHIDEEQQQVREGLKSQLNQKTDALKAISNNKQSALMAELSTLRDYNAAITNITTNSGQNLQIVNALLYKRLKGGIGHFSKREMDELTDIANKCAGLGGPAVYTARALLAEVTFTLPEYDDECLKEVKSPTGKKKATPAQFSKIRISPNPATSKLNITLPANMVVDELQIINALGKPVQTIAMEGERHKQVNINSLEQGIYWITAPNSALRPWKIVIAR